MNRNVANLANAHMSDDAIDALIARNEAQNAARRAEILALGGIANMLSAGMDRAEFRRAFTSAGSATAIFGGK